VPTGPRLANPAPIALLVLLAWLALAGPVGATEYAVESGDTLIAIGDRVGVTVRALTAANDLGQADVLQVGQVLQVPTDDARPAPSARGGRPSGGATFTPPLRGSITTYFREHGPYWAQGYHTGLDIAAPIGTPIGACGDGVVVEAESSGNNGGYGSYVKIDHGGGLISIYGHMSAVLATPGDRVTTGTVIGRVGMTGNTTGPHVHWEVRQDGQIRDPLGYVP
jgi:murein DD-endopeptidase MepM/ murein hydrolase activator NlpD